MLPLRLAGPYAEREKLTHIFLDGFFDGRPKRTKLLIYHGPGGKPSEVSTDDLHPGKTLGYGSQLIMGLLSPDLDPQYQTRAAQYLSSYRLRCQTVQTMPQALDAALATIQAHCDPEALKIDPKTCEAVGGRIHAVTITPHEGFQWVPGFEPLTQS